MSLEVEGIDPNLFKDSHAFLAEPCLVPNVDKTNGSRLILFSSHINQAVVLKKGEYPRVFTNFENAMGEVSSSYRLAENDLTVLHKIVKNAENYVLVVKDKSGKYDIIERKPCERTTEHYGWKIINDIDNYSPKKGENKIKSGNILFRSTAHDADMNFNYGSNLKAAYIPYKNMTFEDAIVISESGAEKLTSYTIKEFTININKNDILLNLYGNMKNFKSFPDIGELVKNRVLLARRRIDYDSFLFDMSVESLNNINYNTDKIFYTEIGESKVVDIDVYSNTDIESLTDFKYNMQLAKYLKMSNSYYTKLVEVLEPIVNSKKKYSDDLGYLYKRAKEIIDPEVQWINDKSNFDNVVLKIKLLKEEKLTYGSKITGRYGEIYCRLNSTIQKN